MGAGKTVEQWDAWTADMQARHGNGNGHGKSLAIEAQRLALLPTPRSSDSNGVGAHGDGGLDLRTAISLLPTPTSQAAKHGAPTPYERKRWDDGDSQERANLGSVAALTDRWHEYAPAIARHERVFGRPAPDPVDEKKRLSPAFVEWMMGWPEGWVDLDGLSRANRLKILGNGVVPQQAAAAYAALLERAATPLAA